MLLIAWDEVYDQLEPLDFGQALELLSNYGPSDMEDNDKLYRIMLAKAKEWNGRDLMPYREAMINYTKSLSYTEGKNLIIATGIISRRMPGLNQIISLRKQKTKDNEKFRLLSEAATFEYNPMSIPARKRMKYT